MLHITTRTQEAASPQQVEQHILYDLSDLARHSSLLHLAGVNAGLGLPGLHLGLCHCVRPPGCHLQGLQHLTSDNVVISESTESQS